MERDNVYHGDVDNRPQTEERKYFKVHINWTKYKKYHTSHLDNENVWPKWRRPFIYGYGNVTKYVFELDTRRR